MSEPSRERLPFEPRQKKKKQAKKKAPVKAEAEAAPKKEKETASSSSDPSLSAIPEVVSKRMIRRIALFCGIPTGLGVFSFFAAYWIVSRELFELPTYAVVFVSMGLFGLGVLGLSYGLFSTSWEEDRVGGWLGFDEFKLNLGRTIKAWRSAKKAAKGE